MAASASAAHASILDRIPACSLPALDGRGFLAGVCINSPEYFVTNGSPRGIWLLQRSLLRVFRSGRCRLLLRLPSRTISRHHAELQGIFDPVKTRAASDRSLKFRQAVIAHDFRTRRSRRFDLLLHIDRRNRDVLDELNSDLR